ncbi:MAG: hypothetical protein ACTSU0_07890 [Alphaproteobacteria bacterium]
MNAASNSVEVTPMEHLDEILALSDAALADDAQHLADVLLAIGETALESWVVSRGQHPTSRKVEGFRLLALHRQGARGEPSFNACRETSRELVYQINCIRAAAGDRAALVRLVRLGAMVARHLVLFIDGKLEVAGLGDFCCSSRPLRLQDAVPAATT